MFPWRCPPSAYASAVAEILLIRTPPEQVLPVYRQFMRQYRCVTALYKADISEVASLIMPLGLRWRAESLTRMAAFVVEELAGKYPNTFRELQHVPGIGPYVASAVLLFYYRKRAVLVDANSVRFIHRYFGHVYSGEARRNRALIARMDALTPHDESEAVCFGESFLDFMRDVCRSSLPLCYTCPLNVNCAYYS